MRSNVFVLVHGTFPITAVARCREVRGQLAAEGQRPYEVAAVGEVAHSIALKAINLAVNMVERTAQFQF